MSDWSPLAPARLSVAPEALATGTIPQLAKDVDYARAIQQVWESEVSSAEESESTPFTYQDANGENCYGHLVRRKKGDTPSSITTTKVPGILFFHTGAGPHDIFLHWKADALVTNQDVFPDGCIVLVADILSDDTGWSWGADRSKYNAARGRVLAADSNSTTRTNLQIKIEAALDALKSMSDVVDESRLGAMGWCLGGHSVLELSRMKPSGLKAMVTFHGVFDGIPAKTTESSKSVSDGCQILICNGADDPFVLKSILQNAMDTMKQYGHTVTLLELEGARHGFSSPAQDHNPNEAFGFNEAGAKLAWSSSLDLFKSL